MRLISLTVCSETIFMKTIACVNTTATASSISTSGKDNGVPPLPAPGNVDTVAMVKHTNGTCYSTAGEQLGLWNYSVFYNATGVAKLSPSSEYY